MSRKSIRPSTLDGIKRLASSLKAEQQIQHARALDLAAQAAGFQNFIHAGHVLRNAPGTESRPSGHLVYLTAYWKDRESNSSGRETLSIRLSSLWTELITPALLRNHHALANSAQKAQIIFRASSWSRHSPKPDVPSAPLRVPSNSWMPQSCAHPGASAASTLVVTRATPFPGEITSASGTTERPSATCLPMSPMKVQSKTG